MDKDIKNIYLSALKIGYNKKDEGISYNALKKHLEKENHTIKEEDEFRRWFYENFQNQFSRSLKNNSLFDVKKETSTLDDKNLLLSYNAFMDYVNYLKLEQAKASAKTALKLSHIVIWISAFALLTNVIFLVRAIVQEYQKVEVSTISPQVQEQVANKIYDEKKHICQEKKPTQQLKSKEFDSTMQTKSKKDTLAFQRQKQ